MAAINESTIRQSVFKALYTTLDANKPSGWTIKSKMPQIDKVNSSLPLIVFNVAVDDDLITLDKSTISDYTVSASFMFIASESKRNSMEDVDGAVDTIRAQLKANQTTWEASGFYISGVNDEFSDMEIIGGNRLLTAALSCQIKLITTG